MGVSIGRRTDILAFHASSPQAVRFCAPGGDDGDILERHFMKHETTMKQDIPSAIRQARNLLDTAGPEASLDSLNASRLQSPLIENARGVCLLRLGEYNDALLIFRRLVFPNNAFAIPDNTPIAYRVNYVTTFFLQNNVIIGLQLLNDILQKQHPLVRQLADAVKRWKRTLPLWRRLLLPVGVYPSTPFLLDYPAGAMWLPEEEPQHSEERTA